MFLLFAIYCENYLCNNCCYINVVYLLLMNKQFSCLNETSSWEMVYIVFTVLSKVINHIFTTTSCTAGYSKNNMSWFYHQSNGTKYIQLQHYIQYKYIQIRSILQLSTDIDRKHTDSKYWQIVLFANSIIFDTQYQWSQEIFKKVSWNAKKLDWSLVFLLDKAVMQ